MTVAAVAVVLALAAVVAVARLRPAGPDTGPVSAAGTATALVRRETLTSGLTLTGRLAHGDTVTVTGRLAGTYTRLPAGGTVVRAGAPLFEVDGNPVVLFTGDRPFWRSLGPGAPPGEDVRILERNLLALGFGHGLHLAVGTRFTAATGLAVRRWQKALGLPRTGTVELGRVVVVPLPAVRVDTVKAVPGGAATGSDTVLAVTAPQVGVSVDLAAGHRGALRPGARVRVALAGGGILTAVVRSVDPVPPDGPGGGGNGGGTGGSGNGGAGDQPEARATLTVADQSRAAAALASGPPTVTVTVTDQVAPDAIVVPVTALTALAGGGYAVRVVPPGGSATRLVPVRLGLVTGAQAQITGPVRPGERVVVPS